MLVNRPIFYLSDMPYCLVNKQISFLLPLEIPYSESDCDVTDTKIPKGCKISELSLAKIAYSTIVHTIIQYDKGLY